MMIPHILGSEGMGTASLVFTFTFSHLADAFIQSDLHMCDLQCIHILHFTLMAHCTSGAIRGSVSCSRTLRQGIEPATFCLLNDFFTTVPLSSQERVIGRVSVSCQFGHGKVKGAVCSLRMWAAVVQEVKKSFSNQKVASSIPCRSVLEQDTEPLIAPDVQCAISVNVKCVYIVSRTYVSRFG